MASFHGQSMKYRMYVGDAKWQKVKDCPGFETFGADVKEARKAKNLARKDLAEKVNIDTRYLANIENESTIPSLPVIIQLVKIYGLPMERYFNPEVMREESDLRQRVGQKLKLCPEQYLPIVEDAIDGALKIFYFFRHVPLVSSGTGYKRLICGT